MKKLLSRGLGTAVIARSNLEILISVCFRAYGIKTAQNKTTQHKRQTQLELEDIKT